MLRNCSVCHRSLAKVCCRFEFLYKQAVACTDAFLGMMDKDVSSACCEDLELRIDLPDANSLSGDAPSWISMQLPCLYCSKLAGNDVVSHARGSKLCFAPAMLSITNDVSLCISAT